MASGLEWRMELSQNEVGEKVGHTYPSQSGFISQRVQKKTLKIIRQIQAYYLQRFDDRISTHEVIQEAVDAHFESLNIKDGLIQAIGGIHDIEKES